MVRQYGLAVKRNFRGGDVGKMGKQTEVRKRIKKVMAALGIQTQAEFARTLGFKLTTLNAWMTGTSLPSPEAYATLARESRDTEDAFYFLERAGLRREVIDSAAALVVERRRALMGEIAPIGRFHQTEEGMQEDGPPVGVSAEYIYDPISTVWIVVN